MSSAIISPCGKYRYVLRRSIPSVIRWHRPALFIMLNPSVADATVNDPTIRRCMRFAERWGMTQLTVVNLFAFRATDPSELKFAEDPVGPENDKYIEEEIQKHSIGIIVAAWGAHPFPEERAEEIIKKFGPFQCLGTTKAGRPKHPLYIKSEQPLVEYNGHS